MVQSIRLRQFYWTMVLVLGVPVLPATLLRFAMSGPRLPLGRTGLFYFVVVGVILATITLLGTNIVPAKAFIWFLGEVFTLLTVWTTATAGTPLLEIWV